MSTSIATAIRLTFQSQANRWLFVLGILLPIGLLTWTIFQGYAHDRAVTFGRTKADPTMPKEIYFLWAPVAVLALYWAMSLVAKFATSADGDGIRHRESLDSFLVAGGAAALIGIVVNYIFWLFRGVHNEYSQFLAPTVPLILFGLCIQNGWRALTHYGSQISNQGMQNRHVDSRPTTSSHPPSAMVPNLPAASTVFASVPTLKFKGIYGNDEIKRRLLDASQKILGKRKAGDPPRNGILLHGEPGNGKTVFAEALAGELGVNFVPITYGDVVSQWMGETPRKIREAFQSAKAQQPCVLFIDEIDSFLTQRGDLSNDGGGWATERRDIVNTMLTNLVDVRKEQIVVIAATNFLENLDAAAMREGRFDFKVEITPPDQEARVGLLTHGLNKQLPKMPVDASTIETVATRWNGFSVKRILAVTEEMPTYLEDCQREGKPVQKLEFDDFMAALRNIQGRKGARLENVKPLSEMILPQDTLDSVTMIANRLKDPVRIERLGGTLPSGIIFFGPPGTGKTAVCKALAKECDYAFIVKTGTDLANNPSAVEKVYKEAKELRPAIIFIDEADDLLRNREMSGATQATNKLLTLMDGVADKVKDVVWVAATNHIEQVDSALMRGGRFTEKIQFFLPGGEQLEGYIKKWLDSRRIELEAGVGINLVCSYLKGESVANTEAVLQYAVNRAIGRTTKDSVTLQEADIVAGCRVVLKVEV